MSNEIYPKLKGLAYPIVRKYAWNTLKTYEHPTGRTKTYISQLYPSSITFELQYSILRDWGFGHNELTALVGFFNAMKAGYEDFLFDDVDFNMLTDQVLKTADGFMSQFQIVANYGAAVIPVYGKVKDGFIVKLNGTIVNNYTINDYGVITFDSVPDEGVIPTVSGGFYHRVRFAVDVAEVSQMAYNASSMDISLKTFKPSGALL